MTVRHNVAGAFVFGACLLTSAPSNGKATLFFEPGIGVWAGHDDNLFSTSSDERSDFFLRVTPELTVGAESERSSITALHTFDAEAYRKESDLDSAQVRRFSEIAADHALTPRLGIMGAISFTKTDTARELIPELGLDRGREKAKRRRMEAGAEYRVTPTLTASVGYTRVDESIVDDVEIEDQEVAVGLAWRASETSTYMLDYSHIRDDFDDGEQVRSHVATVGWEGRLSPRLAAAVRAGVRRHSGSSSAEADASFTYSLASGEVGARYARTHTTMLGVAGLVRVEIVEARLVHSFTPAFAVTVRPAHVWSERGPDTVKTRRAEVEFGYRFNPSTRLSYTFSHSHETGSLEDPSEGTIQRNLHLFGIEYTFARRPRRQDGTP